MPSYRARPVRKGVELLLAVGLAGCSGGSSGGGASGGGSPTATGGATTGTGGVVGTGGSGTGGSGAAATGGRSSGGGAGGNGGRSASGGGVATGGSGGPAGGTGGSGGRAAVTGGVGGGSPRTGGMPATGGAGGAPQSSEICARWKADRTDLSEGTWTGATATCEAGDLGEVPRANALRLVNLYRWLAALPPVVTDPALDAKDQQCALMQRANNTLSHTPPTTWTCYTQDGADAAGSSNISSGRAVSSVDDYMVDPGNATTLGHRRWILSNSLGPIGIGGTDKSSCMWTLGGKGKAGRTWSAWPAPGVIPFQAFKDSYNRRLDDSGWSVQSETINLTAAQVSVTVDGASQPVTVTALDQNYGARYAIRFNPMGWTTAAGKTYDVSITGISTPISYSVQVVSCP